MRSKIVVAVMATMGLVGCAEDRNELPHAADAPTSAPGSPDVGNVDAALAFADPGDSNAADHAVRALQTKLRGRRSNDDVVLLGRAWIRKARESGDPGFYLHAKACAEMVLDDAPSDVLALGLRSQVELNDHRFEDALATAEQILSQRPEDLVALASKVDATLELGRYDEAVAAADQLVDLKPSLPSYARVSHLAWLHGDARKAKESVRLAIESGRDPSDPEPRCHQIVQAANIFWHEGDYEGARAGFNKALGECPGYAKALAGAGRAALALGEHAHAVELLQKATEKSPSIEALWWLGDAQAAAGDAAGAERTHARLVERGKVEDRRTTALFLASKNRDLDEAVRLARLEMKERPGIHSEDALAWALFRKGDVPAARELSSRAMRLGTPDAGIEFHAGVIAIAAGHRAEGEAILKKLIARSPEFDRTGAREARDLLGGLVANARTP